MTSDGLLVTARYRIVQSEPRSTEGDPRELTHQLRVYPDRLEALRAHLGAHSEVACRYWETSGGCPERPPIIDLPPFDFGQPPVPPFDTMPEAWPQRICALETSGVPTALRVELSNCGERVVCRVREGRGPIALEVRTDPSTMPACISAIRASASCAVLRPLAAGQQTVRVNDRVSMQVDTDASGALPPGRCWDVPAPPAARRGPRRAP